MGRESWRKGGRWRGNSRRWADALQTRRDSVCADYGSAIAELEDRGFAYGVGLGLTLILALAMCSLEAIQGVLA